MFRVCGEDGVISMTTTGRINGRCRAEASDSIAVEDSDQVVQGLVPQGGP